MYFLAIFANGVLTFLNPHGFDSLPACAAKIEALATRVAEDNDLTFQRVQGKHVFELSNGRAVACVALEFPDADPDL